MATKLAHPQITEIPNTEPGATPGLWNTRYYEIDENFEAIASYTPVGKSTTAADGRKFHRRPDPPLRPSISRISSSRRVHLSSSASRLKTRPPIRRLTLPIRAQRRSISTVRPYRQTISKRIATISSFMTAPAGY